VGFSDWLNLILHGGNAGEVMGMFAHRLFANMEQKRFKKKYTKFVSFTNLASLPWLVNLKIFRFFLPII